MNRSASLIELLPTNRAVPKGHLLVVIKSYFDGANKADSTQYDVVTLAAVSGTPSQWRRFEADWRIALRRHGAGWLHTTDAVSLQDPFTLEKEWSVQKVDALISDCVKVLEEHIALPLAGSAPPREGLMPFTATIVLSDFKRARGVNSDVPKDATEILATQALNACFEWGTSRGTDWYDLFFDKNEPYRGHVVDRKRNPKARRQVPEIEKVSLIAEADMVHVPALQMADLLAWCVSHKRTPARNWQKRLLSLARVDEWLEYNNLIKPIPGVADLIREWKLSPRKPTR